MIQTSPLRFSPVSIDLATLASDLELVVEPGNAIV